jgi:uncharacterized protein
MAINFRITRLAGLFLLIAALAAAKELPTLPKKAGGKPAAGERRGLVWRIDGGKSPVYLAGSFHLLRKKDLPYPRPIEIAYRASQEIWFEMPPGEVEDPQVALKMMAAGALPAGTRLENVVSAETYRKVEKWDGEPIVKQLLNSMRPWMAALTVTMIEYQKLGGDPRYGIEKVYEEKAKQDHKPTAGFETADFQIGLFSNFTADQQEEMLSQTFDELKESRGMIDQLITAWRNGDGGKLAKLLDEGFKDHADIKKLLLTDRNARWIEPIEKLLQGDKPALVIVGAGHLCGEGSVVEILEKKGWKLARVEPGDSR